MTQTQPAKLVRKKRSALRRMRSFLFGARKFEHWILIVLSVIIGIIASYAAIGFYFSIHWVLEQSFGVQGETLASHAAKLDWWLVLSIPILGGLVAGQLLRFLPGNRASGVAEVMEAAALRNGRMNLREGIVAAVTSVVSLGSGASAGREGPVVHLGATLSAFVAEKLQLPPQVGRILLGCGVAAAVSSSFNAPIAGVFFALEVIIGHYALHAFAPIVISAVIGALVSRAHKGDFPTFEGLTNLSIASPWEFPAFFLLGVACALVASAFMRSLIAGQRIEKYLSSVPYYFHPAIGGIIIGAMAIYRPEILSVGYEATSNALMGSYSFGLLFSLIFLKIIATSVTLGARFGGGIFSPSLFIGAMTGGAFGIVVGQIAPELASSPGLYAVVGMGAVASAVLGAPISTILIVFELTGDYSITIAVMIASAISSLVTSIFYKKSYFHHLLASRGVRLEGGKATYLLKSAKVMDHLDRDFFTIREEEPVEEARELLIAQGGGKLIVTDEAGSMVGVLSFNELPLKTSGEDVPNATSGEVCRRNPVAVKSNDHLEIALNQMDLSGEDSLPVVSTDKHGHVVGIISHRTVLSAYNRALIETQGHDGKLSGHP